MKRKSTLLPRLILFLALIFLLVVLWLAIRRNRTAGVQNPLAAESSGTVQTDTDRSQSKAATPRAKKNEYLTLTGAQIHTGDLILVSSKYAYDFNANKNLIDLVTIKKAQTFSYPVDKDNFQISSRVMDQMDKMIKACDDAVGTSSHRMSISSAYRSKAYQQNVWDESVKTNGEDYTKKYVAVPGYSEHHTGLAVDFGITNNDGTAGSFSGSKNAEWMNENSWRYGFVRRYPTDKVDITGISNESWHFRFVGVPHAKLMHEKGYVLEEYLDYLKQDTSRTDPAVITADGITYHIWYTASDRIRRPAHKYTVSGNNIDGYIITEQVENSRS